MKPTLTKISDNARIVTIGKNEYFFSYETLIAFRSYKPEGVLSIRLENVWSRTTGKHFNQMGCKDFTIMEQSQFEDIVQNYS